MEKYKSIFEEQERIEEIDKEDIKYLTKQGIIDIGDLVYLGYYFSKKIIFINSSGKNPNLIKGIKIISEIPDWDILDLQRGTNKKYTMYVVY